MAIHTLGLSALIPELNMFPSDVSHHINLLDSNISTKVTVVDFASKKPIAFDNYSLQH